MMSNYFPEEANIVVDSTGDRNSCFGAAVAACDIYDFAVVSGYHSGEEIEAIAEQAELFFEASKQAGDGLCYATRPESNGGFDMAYATGKVDSAPLENLLSPFVNGLITAALKSQSMRMQTERDARIRSMIVNTYPYEAHIPPHIDGSPGIVVVYSAVGIGEAVLSSRGTNNEDVSIKLEPGAYTVLPARTNDYQAKTRQARHSVKNITPKSESNGVRRSIAIPYW